jgi:hypothetical protein
MTSTKRTLALVFHFLIGLLHRWCPGGHRRASSYLCVAALSAIRHGKRRKTTKEAICPEAPHEAEGRPIEIASAAPSQAAGAAFVDGKPGLYVMRRAKRWS